MNRGWPLEDATPIERRYSGRRSKAPGIVNISDHQLLLISVRFGRRPLLQKGPEASWAPESRVSSRSRRQRQAAECYAPSALRRTAKGPCLETDSIGFTSPPHKAWRETPY